MKENEQVVGNIHKDKFTLEDYIAYCNKYRKKVYILPKSNGPTGYKNIYKQINQFSVSYKVVIKFNKVKYHHSGIKTLEEAKEILIKIYESYKDPK